jgi:DNA repair exonuclease SbcCD ATPase subunit
MHIDRLRLHDVQRHADLEVEFAPGLTVVRGPNESGKSTLQRAIEFALFRKVTALSQDVDRLRRWGAGDDAAPTVEMAFTTDEGASGHLVKTFAGVRGKAELRIGSEQVTDPAEIERRLVGLTGIPSEKFFRSTAAIHHRELADLDRDEGALRDRLQISVSGGDRGTSGARKKLEEAIRRYAAEGPKNPGMVKAVRHRALQLETQFGEGESALARLETERAALSRARDAHAAVEREVEVDREQLAAAERAVTLLARLGDAQARYERYRRAAELSMEIAAREGAHPSHLPLSALRAAVERLRLDEGEISGQRARLAERPETVDNEAAVPALPDWRRPALGGAVLTVAGIAAAVVFGSGVGTSPSSTAAYAGLAAAAAGGLLVLLALFRRRRGSDARQRNLLRTEQLARQSEGRSEIERQLVEAEATRAVELEGLGLADALAAEALLTAEAEHVASIDRLKAELRGLLGEEPPGDAPTTQRDAAAAEAEQARSALAGMGEIGADPARARARHAAAVEAGLAERDRVMRLQAEAEGRVGANDVDAEAVAVLSEQLAEARERLVAAERRQRILRATLAGIDAAEKATMKRVARFLERHMAGDVARLTGGRYRRVRVDEAELKFSVWSPERGDWVDVHSLSQGTLDQFYLAARLGLVRQVTQGRRPPLIFDDPFLTFDDERARRALELLRETAADLQVIYLTISERYDAIADRVVVLEAPTGQDSEAPIAPSGGTT